MKGTEHPQDSSHLNPKDNQRQHISNFAERQPYTAGGQGFVGTITGEGIGLARPDNTAQ